MSYVLRCVFLFLLKLDKSIKFAEHKHYCEMNLGIGFVILEWDMRDVDTVTSKCKVHSQSTTNSYGEAQVAYDVFLSVTSHLVSPPSYSPM